MAPLILHNVPDEELYIGDDGIKRPYAMVFPQSQQDGSMRPRRAANETGAFGKSTRRARTKTATPARKEDPTVAAADRVFSSWIANQAIINKPPPSTMNSTSTDTNSHHEPNSQSSQNPPQDETDSAPAAKKKKPAPIEPTEVILRGYRSPEQQYSAINHYEQIAGMICEDYPRDPPAESRRYRSEMRDPAFRRRRPLTPAERAKVNNADSGNHWVKVTFESQAAARAALYASPQGILGYLVYAEPYAGSPLPPDEDEAIPDPSVETGWYTVPPQTTTARRRSAAPTAAGVKPGTAAASGFRPEWLNPDGFHRNYNIPASSETSSTVDTGTVDSTPSVENVTIGPGGGTGSHPPDYNNLFALASHTDSTSTTMPADLEFCKTIPTARKVKLLTADQALLPSPTYAQRAAHYVPFIKWFNGAMIGNQVPRNDQGEFDWANASIYWRFLWWLDFVLKLFGGEIYHAADKDD
ncbi:hypothetical protein QBC35DRAFT_155325 [Podospora australis]|uniref:Nucleoporin NUP53 n=1 Tax=Podospora australis TaxID=1536484 RepID=A0AAN7AHW5_9PEZI|nr:hypothetical protein QBC35DRAFT_155325 [Podospora australis]